MRLLFRVAVAFAAALCVWLVASPAKAAAPLCDSRGATTFAPPPQLQPPSPSVDVSVAPVCDESLLAGEAVDRGDPPGPQIASSTDASLSSPDHVVDVAAPAPAGTLAIVSLEAPSPGVCARVERPPRV
jgi:hypothetical protein